MTRNSPITPSLLNLLYTLVTKHDYEFLLVSYLRQFLGSLSLLAAGWRRVLRKSVLTNYNFLFFLFYICVYFFLHLYKLIGLVPRLLGELRNTFPNALYKFIDREIPRVPHVSPRFLRIFNVRRQTCRSVSILSFRSRC